MEHIVLERQTTLNFLPSPTNNITHEEHQSSLVGASVSRALFRRGVTEKTA